MSFGKPQKGVCSQCKKSCYYAHRAKKLCPHCNQRRKTDAKREKTGSSGTEERDLFLSIYEERKSRWVSDVSGIPLPMPPAESDKGSDEYNTKASFFFSCFSHVLPKKRYERFRFRKDAIWCVTPEEHSMWENAKYKIKTTDIKHRVFWEQKLALMHRLIEEDVMAQHTEKMTRLGLDDERDHPRHTLHP